MSLRRKISKVKYNFSWHQIKPFVSNPITRAVWLIPIIGYAIIFGDAVTEHFQFTNIAPEKNAFIIGNRTRLQLLYFCCIFLFISLAWFRLRAPEPAKIAGSAEEYVRYGFDHFVSTTFREIYQRCISRQGGTLTQYFEQDDEEMGAFLDALSANDGPPEAVFEKTFSNRATTSPSRTRALDVHSDLVRHLLLEDFAQRTRVRKVELAVLWGVLGLGYLLAAIPSLDLFQAVIQSMQL